MGMPGPFIDKVPEFGRHSGDGLGGPVDSLTLMLNPGRIAAKYALVSGYGMHDVVAFLGCLVGTLEPVRRISRQKNGVLFGVREKCLGGFTGGHALGVPAGDLCYKIT